MKKTERFFRILLSMCAFSMGIYFSTWWGLLGLIPFLTGLFGICPIRVLSGKQACPLGICPISKKKN
ncbi:DUF2892 domain-containing protein [Campylobacter insulaenigrae]|nr:DUF2892 domain-containing protein [Campylobacter insulaenigrae]MCR6570076.1 DUF2892 domain-containing protein [Campylobacter insulaenigrae]MCR6571861.1 DUF2892 domain-containing protein [Campylobacter insulaenigrae]MCR6574507.1 DUF2892 domain-containing protein [Campylobacter insulaenigrae]MCR6576107.1 DUF2892 domain-containing protein [Campylobacter insulaenigrae]MCR6577645.1 DUF2892 domain-containing protein [Campylobacter insulaenigrae]